MKPAETLISHFIKGRTVGSESGRSQPVYNPATGEVTAHVALASVDEVNAAVSAASAAAPAWADTAPLKRARDSGSGPRPSSPSRASAWRRPGRARTRTA